MKSKLLFFDLSVCSVWMLSMFGARGSWTVPTFLVMVLLFLGRIVLSFSLYHQEKRAWLPLLVFVPLVWLSFAANVFLGLGDFLDRVFVLTKLEHNATLVFTLCILITLWLFVAPYVCYFILLLRKKLARTDLTWEELLGGILWHGRLEKTAAAMLMIMLLAFLTGLSMSERTCQAMCLTAAPLTYWLLCHYKKVKADKLWMLAVSMVLFWYAQILGGAWRASLLLVSFGLVVYVGTRLFKHIRSYLLVNVLVLYLGILLPSFSIGYNQYACMNYARKGFYHLSPFEGIIYITDSSHELYGLRDRYGLLVEPEYERIVEEDRLHKGWSYIYVLQKDGYERYYDVLTNRYIHEPDIHPGLQRDIIRILSSHFANKGSEYDDLGEIRVTDMQDGKSIADVRVQMDGESFLVYNSERFLPDDSVSVVAGEFFRKDSVEVGHYTKHYLSHAVQVPNDSVSAPRYEVYMRLATERVPKEEELQELAEKVADLKELNEKVAALKD